MRNYINQNQDPIWTKGTERCFRILNDHELPCPNCGRKYNPLFQVVADGRSCSNRDCGKPIPALQRRDYINT